MSPDDSADSRPIPEEDKAFARRTTPLEQTCDQLEPHVQAAEDRQEALVDEGVEETFPASDPVSVKRIT